MSFGAFYAGLSGLQANSGRLNVIGNNLSNLNTVGFKTSRVTFADIFGQPAPGGGINGAGNPQQIGLGTEISGIQQVFSQGSLQTTSLVTDTAVQGNGFFVLSDAAGGERYTRAGNFTFDKDGFLVSSSGQVATSSPELPPIAVPVRADLLASLRALHALRAYDP